MSPKDKIIKDYMTFRAIECKNKDALTNYERYIRAFLEEANNNLTNLTETYLTNYVNKISNRFSQKSLNNIKPLFKNFIKWRFPDYSIKFRNLDKICKTKRAKSSYSPSQMLKEKEVKKIVETENDLFWKVFWLVFFYGGFRGIDTVRLKWKNFTFEKDGTIIIKAYIGKNQKTFYKSLPKEVTPIVKKWKGVNPSEYVFPSTKGDYPIHPKTPNTRLTRISKKALGRAINPYLLRHSLATIKYNEDGQEDDITANQLGHSKSMKETYLHLDESKLIKRAKRVWTDKNEMPRAKKHKLEIEVEELKKAVKEQAKFMERLAKKIQKN